MEHRYLRVNLFTVSLIVAALCFSCAKKTGDTFYPVANIVVGECKVIPEGGEEQVVEKDMQIKPGDVLIIPSKAKLKLTLSNENSIYLNENTELSVETMDKADGNRYLHLNFSKGDVFAVLNNMAALSSSFSISTGNAAISLEENAHFAVYHEENKTMIISLSGRLSCTPRQGDDFNLSPCQKALVDNSGVLKTDVAKVDKEHLVAWVSESVVGASLAHSGCEPISRQAENLPPIWLEEPQTSATVGKIYRDTIFAQDPESTRIVFSLIEGPVEMKVDSFSGELSFKPSKAGAFSVVLRASDEQGASDDFRYDLVVDEQEAQLRASLFCSKQVSPGDAVTIDASRSKNKPEGPEELMYRFDVNGDNKWDYPSDGTYGKKAAIKHTYKEQGEYRIKVQIKNAQGKTAQATRKIIVNSPPVAQISVKPSSGTIGTEFVFSAEKSTDGTDPLDELTVRWDFDDDGVWDYPGENGFAKEKTATWSWDNQGDYVVTCEVRDRYGAVSSTKITVTVSEALEIKSLAGPDSASVGSDVSFVCNLVTTDTAGITYAWDFDGDKKVEKKGPEPKAATSFEKEGNYTITCTVTDKKGRIAEKSRTVSITNAPPSVDAKGPYRVQVNSMLSVNGTASDPDNSIVSYSWDFDNDNKADWSSSTNSRASYTYKNAGEHMAKLTVKSDDGKTALDSTKVVVVNDPPRAFAGKDILSRRKRKILLKGSGKDVDGKIAKYEWDFNGDGTFDWSSNDTGYVEHEFDAFSTAILKVTDSDGESASDTIRIIICPDGMEPVDEAGKFCIDEYEWPNKRNEEPLNKVTYEQARAKCASVGKRLCTAEEWEAACSGGGRKNNIYPYGTKYDVEKCNTLGNSWSDNKPTKSGKYPDCKSRYDVLDMSGNYAEWTAGGNEKSAYVYGGSWQSKEKDSQCTSRVLLSKDTKYFYVGFRCCK
ncbi:MAG: PKD domain-containing protein [Chitinivibrionales bacterium]|nr:PKD domain-containing protein [Chitinivibrionales bacterium]